MFSIKTQPFSLKFKQFLLCVLAPGVMEGMSKIALNFFLPAFIVKAIFPYQDFFSSFIWMYLNMVSFFNFIQNKMRFVKLHNSELSKFLEALFRDDFSYGYYFNCFTFFLGEIETLNLISILSASLCSSESLFLSLYSFLCSLGDSPKFTPYIPDLFSTVSIRMWILSPHFKFSWEISLYNYIPFPLGL